MRAQLALSSGEYQKALQDHGDARRSKVVGTLKKEGRTWLLRDPSPICIVGDEDEDEDEDEDLDSSGR